MELYTVSHNIGVHSVSRGVSPKSLLCLRWSEFTWDIHYRQLLSYETRSCGKALTSTECPLYVGLLFCSKQFVFLRAKQYLLIELGDCPKTTHKEVRQLFETMRTWNYEGNLSPIWHTENPFQTTLKTWLIVICSKL